MSTIHQGNNGFSRRAFLKTAGIGATCAAIAGITGCSPSAEQPEAQQVITTTATFSLPYPDLAAPSVVAETLDVDVVVVGAGISGLAATVQAAELGLSVLCLEKGKVAGGNGSGTEGVFAIGSKMQLNQGIEISPAEIISAELEESQWRGDGSMWLDMCENSAGNIDWLEENGVLFSGVVDNYHTGLFSTMHWFQEVDGSMGHASYIKPMVAAAEAKGAAFRYQMKAFTLIQDEDGTVRGLYAENLETGEYAQINAKAVILASGGIGGNAELLAKQGWQQRNIEEKIVMCNPTVDGDGYKMAINAGAKDYLPLSCDQAFIGIKAVGTDTTPPYSSMLNGGNGIAGAGKALWVNQEGLRFTNEAISHMNMAAPEAACCRQNKATFAIFSQSLVDALIDDPADLVLLNNAVEDTSNKDSIIKADTIAELAVNFGLDESVLNEQIQRYNEYCKQGADLDFGKNPAFLEELTAPYYMARLVPLFVVIIGGVTTNIRSEVIDDNMDAIKGLYAVGLEGAMLHRNVYTQNMPGSNMGNNVNTGRNAAKYAKSYIAGM